MNDNFDAINNINIIKGTIEESKIYYKGLYKLCFILGIYHTMLFILSFISAFFPELTSVNVFLFPILTILVLIKYLSIYNKEKNFSNKYYLSIINIWSFMVIAVPVCITIIELIQYFCIANIVSNNVYLYKLKNFSDVLLFSILIIVYSFIINKKYLKSVAIITLFIYLFLDTCFNNSGLQFSMTSSKNIILSISSIYYFLFVCIGYVVLGLLIKKKVTS